MRLFINKALVYVISLIIFCGVWFGFVCPQVMTIPDNLMAIVGATLYLVGGLLVLFESVRFWKPELTNVHNKLKEAFHEN